MEYPKEPLFRSPLPWSNRSTEALIISCSDHRFQMHFDAFLQKGLGLGSFSRFALPGGPQFLLAADMPMFEKAGRRWTKFLTRNLDIREIICLAHEDWLRYKNMTIRPLNIPLLKERQTADLRKARLVSQEMFPKVGVRMFYAHVVGENKVSVVEFTEVH